MASLEDFQQQQKWVARVIERKDDIIKLLIFYTTLNRRLGRKLPIVLENTISDLKKFHFLKNSLNEKVL